ncbi:hypothetical protein JCM10450v2_003313 [Rhodotorula kratochvilovae]
MSDADPSATLATLTSSLTALESALAPLLAKPLDQHLENEDPLVQARAQVLASYVVHDLIWVYLKTAGVDPAAHPVMAEIERLKTYFGKLKGAERGVPAAGETPARTRMQIDRNAASRFINAAIASQRAQVDPGYTPAEGEDAEAGPSGTHTRFGEDEAEEEEVEAEAVGGAEVDALLEDRPEDEEETPAADVGEAMEVEPVVVQEEPSTGTPAKGKGKEAGKGKKRKSLDPFAGYDQPKPSTPRSAASASKAKAPKSIDSPRTRSRTDAAVSSGSGASTPTGVGAAGEERVSKNARKKLRMKQGAK